MQDLINHLTLPQGILGAAVVLGLIHLVVRLADAAVDLVRVLKGRTDRDVEEVAIAIDALAEAVRDGVKDQLNALGDIERAVGEVHETATEIAGYRPVAATKG